MKISFCTTVSKRLWQLKQTLPHNVKFTKVNEIEICVVAYNDHSIKGYLEKNFQEYLDDGRIVLSEVNDSYIPLDGSSFACGYVKRFSHQMAKGKVIFNLDADNFIDETLVLCLSRLRKNQLLITDPREMKEDGRSGRIGMHKVLYDKIGGYRDMGRSDDIDLCRRASVLGVNFIYNVCDITPIPNDQKDATK